MLQIKDFFTKKFLLGAVIILFSAFAFYFPYSILARFIFNTIFEYVLRLWDAWSRYADLFPTVADTTPLRIGLTPLVLIGIFIFIFSLKLRKASKKFEPPLLLRLILTISGWYCLLGSIAVILLMWFWLRIKGDNTWFALWMGPKFLQLLVVGI